MDRVLNGNDEKQAIYEIYQACRLCGARGGYKIPIQNVVELDGDGIELRQKIKECIQIEVNHTDRMPPLICELCVDKVNDIYQYLDKCKQNDRRTRQRLGLPLHTPTRDSNQNTNNVQSEPSQKAMFWADQNNLPELEYQDAHLANVSGQELRETSAIERSGCPSKSNNKKASIAIQYNEVDLHTHKQSDNTTKPTQNSTIHSKRNSTSSEELCHTKGYTIALIHSPPRRRNESTDTTDEQVAKRNSKSLKDEQIKHLLKGKSNPSVIVERCPLIARMIRDSHDGRLTLVASASKATGRKEKEDDGRERENTKDTELSNDSGKVKVLKKNTKTVSKRSGCPSKSNNKKGSIAIQCNEVDLHTHKQSDNRVTVALKRRRISSPTRNTRNESTTSKKRPKLQLPRTLKRKHSSSEESITFESRMNRPKKKKTNESQLRRSTRHNISDVMLPPRSAPMVLNASLESVRNELTADNMLEPPRRGRGRPRKTPLPMTPTIKKRRGRPSKTSLDNQMEDKIQEQEEVRLKERQELEIALRQETEQLRIAKEKELEEMAELKRIREVELERELSRVRENLAKQVEQTELKQQQLNNAEFKLKTQMKKMNKLKAVVIDEMEQLQKEREELQRKLTEAQNEAEKSKIEIQARVVVVEIETALAQVHQCSEVISTLQQQLEEVRSKLQTGAGEGTSKTETLNEFRELMESELKCGICGELFVEATTLKCTHSFCKYCITMWKKEKKICPICRTLITSECNSLVLDSFIEKMVQCLTDEMKKKRQEMLLFRAATSTNTGTRILTNMSQIGGSDNDATAAGDPVPAGTTAQSNTYW